MAFLSQMINKPIFLADKQFAKVIDFGMPSTLQSTEVSTVLLKKGKQKFAIPCNEVVYKDEKFEIQKDTFTSIPYNPDDFYLVEDLLDKQVIDITGKRLVRVNDVLLKENGGFRISAIDISMAGIARRLGFGNTNLFKTVTIPWSAVEAFDYRTGDVRLKLGKSNLNNLHPAELADILEEAGTLQREGIVEALDADTAADAIEEANIETQEAIFEQLPQDILKKILGKMPLSEIADVIDEVNPQTFKRILKLLGTEKAKRLQKLMLFPDDVAGGLMQVSFYKTTQDKTIGEVLGDLTKLNLRVEAIIITDKEGKLVGQVHAHELINANPHTNIGKLVSEAFCVYEDEQFSSIFRKFSQYNLRALPVVSKDNVVIGVISIDAVMRRIEEEEERDDAL